jgi:hypothetical protein
MGAWGEGMQANDTALDAIGDSGLNDLGDDIKVTEKSKRKLERVKKNPKLVRKLFQKKWIKETTEAVLGLAEFLLDNDAGLTGVRRLVKGAIAKELDEKRLECWRDGGARKRALLRFRDRVDGKDVDMKAVEMDNEGLMSRMTRTLGGMRYEEVYGDK